MVYVRFITNQVLLLCKEVRQFSDPCLSLENKVFFSCNSLDGGSSTRHLSICFFWFSNHSIKLLMSLGSQKKEKKKKKKKYYLTYGCIAPLKQEYFNVFLIYFKSLSQFEIVVCMHQEPEIYIYIYIFMRQYNWLEFIVQSRLILNWIWLYM